MFAERPERGQRRVREPRRFRGNARREASAKTARLRATVRDESRADEVRSTCAARPSPTGARRTLREAGVAPTGARRTLREAGVAPTGARRTLAVPASITPGRTLAMPCGIDRAGAR